MRFSKLIADAGRPRAATVLISTQGQSLAGDQIHWLWSKAEACDVFASTKPILVPSPILTRCLRRSPRTDARRHVQLTSCISQLIRKVFIPPPPLSHLRPLWPSCHPPRRRPRLCRLPARSPPSFLLYSELHRVFLFASELFALVLMGPQRKDLSPRFRHRRVVVALQRCMRLTRTPRVTSYSHVLSSCGLAPDLRCCSLRSSIDFFAK